MPRLSNIPNPFSVLEFRNSIGANLPIDQRGRHGSAQDVAAIQADVPPRVGILGARTAFGGEGSLELWRNTVFMRGLSITFESYLMFSRYLNIFSLQISVYPKDIHSPSITKQLFCLHLVPLKCVYKSFLSLHKQLISKNTQFSV